MPLDQQGNAEYFYGFYTSAGAKKTGLTPTVDVWRNRVQIVTAAATTEMGDGIYYYQLTAGSNNAAGEYIAVFHTADTSVDQQDIPAIWVIGKAGVPHLDADVSSRASPGAAMTLSAGAIVSGTFGAGAIDNAAIATDAIGAAELAADAVTEIGTGVWATTTRALTDKANFTLSAAGVQAIWDALTSAFTIPGSAGKLLADNLNATVGGVAASVWAVGVRTLSAFGFGVTVTTNNDKTGYALTSGEHAAIAADTETGLTDQGYTSERAVKLDDLDAAISSRLPTASYTAPDNASITTIKAKTDNLPGAPAAVGSIMRADLTQALDTSNTGDTVGGALLGARAQAFGKWAVVGNHLNIYAADGVTLVRQFTLDSASNPTSRT